MDEREHDVLECADLERRFAETQRVSSLKFGTSLRLRLVPLCGPKLGREDSERDHSNS